MLEGNSDSSEDHVKLMVSKGLDEIILGPWR